MGDNVRVSFTGSTGSALAGRLDLSPGEPRGFALFAHCFTCSKESAAASRISRELAALGLAVLRFDFTGLGESEGDFSDTTFSANVSDVVAAAEFLRLNYRAPTLLVGHSLRGAAVIAAAHHIPAALAVVTVGAPFDPGHVLRLMDDSLPLIESQGRADVVIGGRTIQIGEQFLSDLQEHRQMPRNAELGRPVLVMHSPQDEIVGVDNARGIFEAARHPKSFIALDGADHLLSRRSDADYAAGLIAAWAAPHLGRESLPMTALAVEADPVAPPGVVVGENADGPYGQTITSGRHAWRADEPVEAGGSDTGPGPYELLLSALGACTSMTIRMYARRKGIHLDHVAVTLQHERIHAEDCAGCEAHAGSVDRISRSIDLKGDLSDADRAALLRIADKCPVHRTLQGSVHIVTTDGRAGLEAAR